ncbi:hypothetical protein ACWGII_14130 [Streptomyces sp. NPDC054855]
MSALPRTVAAVLIASLALMGGATAASAQPADSAGAHQPTDDGPTSDLNVVHHSTNVASFGDMVLD